jgi:hypothetical protein
MTLLFKTHEKYVFATGLRINCVDRRGQKNCISFFRGGTISVCRCRIGYIIVRLQANIEKVLLDEEEIMYRTSSHCQDERVPST